MKSGEKKALWFVLLAAIGILGLTVSLEIQHRQNHPSDSATQQLGANAPARAATTPVNVIPKDLNPYDLPEPDSRGATLLNVYCVQCHDLPTPLMHSADEWDDVLVRMSAYIQDRRGGLLMQVLMPPKKDWQLLTEYLHQQGQKGIDTAQLADLDSPQGQAFIHACSQCHGAPDPGQHKLREWPRVVLRMKANMRTAGLTPPDAQGTELIVAYLQGHSGKD